jgi:hypothetical protein
MNRQNKLGAAVVAAAMLVGASAFAESRPSRETRRQDGGRIQRGDRGTSAQGRSAGGSERRRESSGDTARRNEGTRERTETRTAPRTDRTDRSFESRNDRGTTNRNDSRGTYDRNNRNESRGTNRNDSRGTYDRNNRNDSRGTYDRNRSSNGSRGSYDRNRGGYNNSHRGSPQYYRGRVSRYERWNSGYRVWIVGAPYPFYVPIAYWNAGRFGIGLDIRLGGYYNSLGYYEYYDGYNDGYRDSSYRDGRVYNTTELSGTVEDYDFRRRTALVRDDATGDLVTVYMRSRDARLNQLRAGDYIELEGGWKGGLFEAYRVFDVD